jgi:hypothetical protein
VAGNDEDQYSQQEPTDQYAEPGAQVGRAQWRAVGPFEDDDRGGAVTSGRAPSPVAGE